MERARRGLAEGFEELRVYQAAFDLQQAVFERSKEFPEGERYALTDQVRRSARSIGANIAEAWKKRRYEAHFVAKLSDADAELAETEHWLRTAEACGYFGPDEHAGLHEQCRQVGRMLGALMSRSASWCASRPSA